MKRLGILLVLLTALLVTTQPTQATGRLLGRHIVQLCTRFVDNPDYIEDPNIRAVDGLVTWCRNFVSDSRSVDNPDYIVAQCRFFVDNPDYMGDPSRISDVGLRRTVQHLLDRLTFWCTKAVDNPDF